MRELTEGIRKAGLEAVDKIKGGGRRKRPSWKIWRR